MPRPNTSDEIHLATLLEELRQDVGYEADKYGLVNTALFLWDKAQAAEDQHKPLHLELFERYAKSALQALRGQETPKSLSALFPPLKAQPRIVDDDALECELRTRLAKLLLAKRDPSGASRVLGELKERFMESPRVKTILGQVSALQPGASSWI